MWHGWSRSPRLPRWVIALAVVWIFGLHPLLVGLSAPPFIVGPLDWSAHLATAVLLLVNLPWALSGRTVAAALLASVAIDLDHVPHYLGADFLMEGAPRPYPHSAFLVFAALAVGALLPRRAQREVALGIALGLAAHLTRDIGSAAGIPLLWPITTAAVIIPFWIEAALLAALATRAWLMAGSLPLLAGPRSA